MKFIVDVSLALKNGRALGNFDGILDILFIPKKDDTIPFINLLKPNIPINDKILTYFSQELTVEYIKMYEEPDKNNIYGELLLGFFYVNNEEDSKKFIDFLEKKYAMFFWEY